MSRFQSADFSSVTLANSFEPAAYEIKQLDTPEELIQSYRLRYDVYADLGYLSHPNTSRLDIDAYDAGAIPFGAFDATSRRMIGTLRLVSKQPQSRFADLIQQVLERFADDMLTMGTRAPRPHILPSIVSDNIDSALATFNAENFVVSELSRCIVDCNFRGSGVARSLMELGLAQAALDGPALLIGSCLPEHLPMYERYGYVRLPRTGLDLFDSVGQIAIAVVWRSDRLPQPTRSHVDGLLRAMRTNAAEHATQNNRGARVLYRLPTSPGMVPGATARAESAMDIRHLIELFEIESVALDTLLRQHAQLRPLFSRDFRGVDLDALKLSYLQLLKMKADYVQFTCPAFRAAGEALRAGDEDDRRWSNVLLEYSAGETDEQEGYGHEVWARNDMNALGASPDMLVAPLRASARLYGEYFVEEAARHPYAILGAKGVLEHFSIVLSDPIADGMLESRIAGAEKATTFFHHHGVLDIEHVREGDRNLARSLKDERKIRQAFDGACFTSTVYRWMLKSYLSPVETVANSASHPRHLATEAAG